MLETTGVISCVLGQHDYRLLMRPEKRIENSGSFKEVNSK